MADPILPQKSSRVIIDDAFKIRQRKLAKFQAEMRATPTPAEARVKWALDKIGIPYEFQKGFLREKTVRLVDFYFRRGVLDKLPVCLEVDGKYHEEQKDYDDYREMMINRQRRRGVKFVRITNEWVFAQKDLCASLAKLIPRRQKKQPDPERAERRRIRKLKRTLGLTVA